MYFKCENFKKPAISRLASRPSSSTYYCYLVSVL